MTFTTPLPNGSMLMYLQLMADSEHSRCYRLRKHLFRAFWLILGFHHHRIVNAFLLSNFLSFHAIRTKRDTSINAKKLKTTINANKIHSTSNRFHGFGVNPVIFKVAVAKSGFSTNAPTLKLCAFIFSPARI